MQLYSEAGDFKLYHGSMLDMLEVISPNFIDSIVTDPPYELNFMNKGWDNSGIAFQTDTWRKCYSVLKPGGYLLAFGGSRTFHRIAVAIEDAGFEIRDTIMWLYGSGFPKSMNIGKATEAKMLTGSANTQEFKNLQGTKAIADNLGFCRQQFQQGARPNDYTADGHYRTVNVDYQTEEGKQWAGWGTALKPAYEPIIVARKPCEGSCVDNVIQYGVGGINIDDCRVPTDDIVTNHSRSSDSSISKGIYGDSKEQETYQTEGQQLGRFPSNVILTYDETDKEEVIGGMPDAGSGNNGTPYSYCGKEYDNKKTSMFNGDKPQSPSNYNDSGSAARYFYCAKASKRDRDEGLELFEEQRKGGYGYDKGYMNAGEGMFKERQTMKRNTHPTVKPVDLMQYLIRLVTPPKRHSA